MKSDMPRYVGSYSDKVKEDHNVHARKITIIGTGTICIFTYADFLWNGKLLPSSFYVKKGTIISSEVSYI